MRFLVLASALLLSACVNRPLPPSPTPVVPPPPQVSRALLGLTSGELVQQLGLPTIQVREGVGLKLQFRGRGCVLDAYLYPPVQGAGPERVAHVDTRLTSGAAVDQSACIAALRGA